ncbi:MAG: WecB/TagA/CpsF family glycosyltransferase [Candidatus Bipolaricaulota bacterium]|nr:MAG: WecB/TagA/CpsF family glycosyltransferase [Candidatus Bipolaricaulota bacterium]
MTDVTMQDALRILESLVEEGSRRCVFFVNAHTLNLTSDDPAYLSVLRTADFIFGDGTGLRYAARLLHGIRLKDNVNGTDLIPLFFRAEEGKGYRYYLLGSTADAIARAAEHVQRMFPGWELVGYHHGYLDDEGSNRVVEEINAAKPQVLFVGMGNPTQELWIEANRSRLQVPVSVGVGGLFAYWSGDLSRAPAWLRRVGMEWIHLLVRQPRKFRRYVLGNPRFLLRVLWEKYFSRSL